MILRHIKLSVHTKGQALTSMLTLTRHNFTEFESKCNQPHLKHFEAESDPAVRSGLHHAGDMVSSGLSCVLAARFG